jgi:hypothetical protein
LTLLAILRYQNHRREKSSGDRISFLGLQWPLVLGQNIAVKSFTRLQVAQLF